jgi:hypothetical protein
MSRISSREALGRTYPSCVPRVRPIADGMGDVLEDLLLALGGAPAAEEQLRES